MKQKRYLVLVFTLILTVSKLYAQQLSKSEWVHTIQTDQSFPKVKQMAEELIKTGFNAGSGYGEVWIRDLNTFIVPISKLLPKDSVSKRLDVFFQLQGVDGNIVDGYIDKNNAGVGYKYIYSPLAPQFAGHKNTVETDQETSLVQAVYKYVKTTGDYNFLDKVIGGQTVHRRLEMAMEYLMNHRYASKYGLIYGATTADWGDVQPESPWGVELDSTSHLAIDVYDNAMFVIAINHYLELFPSEKKWTVIREKLKRNIRKYLWDDKNQKYIPHIYLNGSPFPADFDENKIYYHGGTAIAIEAGLLSKAEIDHAYKKMVENVKESGAPTIGLTMYPVYPEGFFQNKGMGPYQYQNGGDWPWFGGRMVTQLAKSGFVAESYLALKPMLDLVLRYDGFYEWFTRDGKPAGSSQFRGSAGVLYEAIVTLEDKVGKK